MPGPGRNVDGFLSRSGQFSDSIRVPRSYRHRFGRGTRIASLQAADHVEDSMIGEPLYRSLNNQIALLSRSGLVV